MDPIVQEVNFELPKKKAVKQANIPQGANGRALGYIPDYNRQNNVFAAAGHRLVFGDQQEWRDKVSAQIRRQEELQEEKARKAAEAQKVRDARVKNIEQQAAQ